MLFEATPGRGAGHCCLEVPLWHGAMSLSGPESQPQPLLAEGNLIQPEKNAGAARGHLSLIGRAVRLKD